MVKNNLNTNDEYIKIENHIMDILYIRNKNSVPTFRNTIKQEIDLFFPGTSINNVIASLKEKSKIAEIDNNEIVPIFL